METNKNTKSIGMVYAMTNASLRNEIAALRRGVNGKLSFLDTFNTGGGGTGAKSVDPLSSQGSVILSRDSNLLFAVNAGSNNISSFRVNSSGALTLADVQPAGGIRPVSLCVFNDLLYVANAGNAEGHENSNITGFRLETNGRLSHIHGATYPLSTPNAQPSCIVFSPDGSHIVVSELSTNRLSVFDVHRDGTLNGPHVNRSNGEGPFGSVFLSSGTLLVSEAGPNALSSYVVRTDGNLKVLSGSVHNGQKATCWVAVSRREHFAYTSNAGSGTISIYRVKNNGKLALVENVSSTRSGNGAPIDSGVSRDGRNLYVLNGNQGSISVFRIRNTGRLTRLQVFQNTELPKLGAQGLAVR